MKRKLLFVLIISILLTLPLVVIITSESTKDIQRFTYNFDSPKIESVKIGDISFIEMSLDECSLSAETGQPLLPYYVVSLALPLNKEIDSVVVKPSYKSTIFLKSKIAPQQEYYPMSSNKTYSFSYDTTVYSKDKNTLLSQYKIEDIQYCRGYPILTITLYPTNYNPKQNKVTYYDSFNIIITYKSTRTNDINSLYRNLNKDKDLVETIVDNPMGDYVTLGYQQTAYPGGICDPSQSYDWVVITNASLNVSSGYDYDWTSLMYFRTVHNGFNCYKVAVDDIMNCSAYWNATALFNDTAGRVREFCKDAYTDWGTDYIILGGDWTEGVPSEYVVPYRLFTDSLETDMYDTMPSDVYFSNLDGTFYNVSDAVFGAGKYGTNDKYSELYVGRIPCYNETMLSNAVNKTLWYENTTHSTQWLNNCTFGGANLGWTSTSKQYMDELINGSGYYGENLGFNDWNENHTNTTLNISRWYDADGLWSNFAYSITDENASVINQMGHGDWNNAFSLSGWSAISITHPFFGYTQACLGGRFTGGYAGIEQVMCQQSGGHVFATVMNTGYGYGDDASTQGPNQQQQKVFWDYFFNATNTSMSQWQLGKAFVYSKNKIGSLIDTEDRVWAYEFYSTNFFGDPAVTLSFNTLNSDAPIILSIDGQANMTTIVNPIPTFNWTDVSGASQYWLQISNNSAFTDLLINITNINGLTYPTNFTYVDSNCSFTLPVHLVDYKKYYVRVKAYYS